MELHALHWIRLVAHAHDLPVVGPRAHFEAARQARPLDRQRMIARGREAIRDALEHAAAVVMDDGSLAVHHLAGVDDAPPESLPDRLVAEAHPAQRDLPGELLDPRHRDTRTHGPARPGPD